MPGFRILSKVQQQRIRDRRPGATPPEEEFGITTEDGEQLVTEDGTAIVTEEHGA